MNQYTPVPRPMCLAWFASASALLADDQTTILPHPANCAQFPAIPM
jgi:hypothetical protein